MLPDVIRLGGLGHLPEIFVGHFRRGDDAEDFRDEIMIGKQFI